MMFVTMVRALAVALVMPLVVATLALPTASAPAAPLTRRAARVGAAPTTDASATA